MYDEDDLLPLSAIQHMAFCDRQCALIHIEQIWSENLLTAKGRIFHDKVHDASTTAGCDLIVRRGVRFTSRRLGLSGIADVVEFHRCGEDAGCPLSGEDGRWNPYPVEYKRGRPKAGNCDCVQLCAQAMCLEEMLDVSISKGALFYGQTRRRKDVTLDEQLRSETREIAGRLHLLIRSGRTPQASPAPRCKHCSLADLCMPEQTAGKQRVSDYITKALAAVDEMKRGDTE